MGKILVQRCDVVGARGRCGGGMRMGMGVRKYVQTVAHIRIYWGAGAVVQGRNNIFTIM